MSEAINIFIDGMYGGKNFEDEANLHAIIVLLKSVAERQNVRIQITVASEDPSHTSKMHDVQSFNRLSLLALHKELRNCHGFIVSNRMSGSTYLTIRDIFLIRLANAWKKSIFFFAQDLMGMIDKKANFLSHSTINMLTYVSVRGIKSRDVLQNMGVASENIYVVPDPSIGIQLSPQFHVPGPPGIRYIGVSPRVSHLDKKDLKILSKTLIRLSYEREVSFKFLPFENEDDREASAFLIGQIARDIHRGSQIILPSGLEHPEQMLQEVGQCRLVIGMRIHPIVCAINRHVPIIGITEDDAIKNLLAGIGMTPLQLQTEDDGIALAEIAFELLDRSDVWKNERFDMINELKMRSYEPAEQIISHILSRLK